MIIILSAERIVDDEGEWWAVWLEINQTWVLPTTAPGTLTEADLQAYFDAREAKLWQVAQTKQYAPDIYKHLPTRRVLKAFALVVLDEINILRQEHALSDRTAEQLIAAIKDRL